MDDSSADTAKVRDHMGTGNRLAMVVQKAINRMRESSWAERISAAFLGILLVMLFNLNREVGVYQSELESHKTHHPNTAIEEDISGINEQIGEIHKDLEDIGTRMLHLEYGYPLPNDPE